MDNVAPVWGSCFEIQALLRGMLYVLVDAGYAASN